MNLLKLKQGVKASSFSKALFSTSAVTEYASNKEQVQSVKNLTTKELNEMNDAVSYDGFNRDNDKLFESGIKNQDRTDFFMKISEPKESDIAEVAKTKTQIRKLIEQELEYANFQDELQEFEKNLLLEDVTSNEIVRENFFFKYDANKVNTNKHIVDFKAPGIPHKFVSVAMPHEHVHPQHYVDLDSLTPENLQELYGYYSYLVDLHISQVRPNLHEETYISDKFNRLNLEEPANSLVEHNNKFWEYYHKPRPTYQYVSQTQDINYQKELDALPINHHPDPRGSKFDVEWTEDQKFPHVATRLGYPIFAVSPLEKIIGVETAPGHPSYQFQPFVQTPSMDPDPTLDFEEGEVIYENRRIGEWVRAGKLAVGLTLPLWPTWMMIEFYHGDGAPGLDWMAEFANWHTVPKNFQDGGDWNMEYNRFIDDHSYMNIHYAIKRAFARPMHTMYQACVLAFISNLSLDYATKITYNKDKDLVFVNKPDGWFMDREYVYEVHHLEQMVPSPVGAFNDIGSTQKNGITTLHCMATKDYIKVYNENKYWNLEQKEDLLSQTRSLWTEVEEGYAGRLFVQQNSPSEEDVLQHLKVEAELKEAVAKLGPIEDVDNVMQNWKEDLQASRKKIETEAI